MYVLLYVCMHRLFSSIPLQQSHFSLSLRILLLEVCYACQRKFDPPLLELQLGFGLLLAFWDFLFSCSCLRMSFSWYMQFSLLFHAI